MNSSPAPEPLPTAPPPAQPEPQPRPQAAVFGLSPAAPVELASDSVVAARGTAKANPITRGHRGKIARLPGPLRDMVNRMLRNNIPHQKIVEALDEYDIKVTVRNISNWKTRSGYKEWCLAQDYATALHLHQDNLVSLLRRENASEIPEVGLQVAATRLAEFFLTPAADELFASDPVEYRRRSAHLAQLTAQINNLQKHRDASAREAGFHYDRERNRRKFEKEVEQTRKLYSSEIDPNARVTDPVPPHRNYLPKSSE